MGTRARRQIKPPRKYAGESEDPEKMYVMRLLDEKDVTSRLLKREIYLLWPDDGVWYPAQVREVDVGSKRADVIYTTTDEEENINLAEVIGDKSIAFRESRPSGHQLKPNEILDEEDRPYAQLSPPPESDEEPQVSEEPPAKDDSDAQMEEEEEEEQEEDPSGSDSLEDEEIVASRRRGRGAASDSEPDSQEEDGGPKKRRRVTKRSERQTEGPRPRRQITLSAKAQQLLSRERQAQLEAIYHGREADEEGEEAEAAEQPHTSPDGLPSRDEFSSAEAYEKQLMSRISGSGRSQGAPPRSSSLKGQTSGSVSDQEVREKAVEQIAAALDKVASEIGKTDLPDAKATADGVEMALFTLYGNAGKDYKAKYRSLIFNLRDAANPDLRRRVLLGEIPPAKLVRLGANELASKQLSQWREEKEKEAMKAAVLDTQAAAKFSTAAALASKQSGGGSVVDWRDNTLATSSPPRDSRPKREPTPEAARDGVPDGDGLEPPPHTAGSGELGGEPTEGDAATGDGDGGKDAPELHTTPSIDSKSTAIKPGAAFNWSSIKASALQEWEASPGKAVKEAEDAEPEYQPDEGAVEQEGDQPIDGDAFAIAESTGPHEQVWHGVLGNACPVPLPAAIEYLAGNPAFASGLPSRQMDVRGRVQLNKAEEFMRGLRTSRSRTISLGLLRLAKEASAEETEQLAELLKQYSAKDRCGVLPYGDLEYYLLGSSRLANGLLQACSGGVLDLQELPPNHLLVVAVHRKGLKPIERKPSKETHNLAKADDQPVDIGEAPTSPPPIVSPIAHPSGAPLPPSQAPTASPAQQPAPQSTGPPGLAPPASTSQAHQPGGGQPGIQGLPQNIDLSSLGSLAAVLGVSQGLNLGLPQQPGPAPQTSHPPPQQQYAAHQPPAGFSGAPQQLPPPPGSFPMQPRDAPYMGQPPPQQWAGHPIPQQQQPQPGYQPPQQLPPGAYSHPMQQQQPPPHGQQELPGPPSMAPYGQPPQYGGAAPQRPITLPPPGPRPITLQPPGQRGPPDQRRGGRGGWRPPHHR